jgi:hypothetical protein
MKEYKPNTCMMPNCNGKGYGSIRTWNMIPEIGDRIITVCKKHFT